MCIYNEKCTKRRKGENLIGIKNLSMPILPTATSQFQPLPPMARIVTVIGTFGPSF